MTKPVGETETALTALVAQMRTRIEEILVMTHENYGTDLNACWQGARDELSKWPPRLEAALEATEARQQDFGALSLHELRVLRLRITEEIVSRGAIINGRNVG